MRYRLIALTASLGLLPALASAQTPATPQPPQPAAPAATSPTTGLVDIGGMFTGTDGDEARYERYRDTRDGLYSSFKLNRDGGTYLFDANATHVGYRDQRYDALFYNRRVNFKFDWVGMPLNYSYIVRTPFTTDGTTLTLDNNAQASVQGPTNATNDGTAVGVPCAPGAPPASCSNPGLADQAKANRSVYNNFASQFDLRHTRNTAAFDVNYYASQSVDIDGRFQSSGRKGEQPWGASFAFSNAVEVPLPLDQRTNDATLGASWRNNNAMFRVGWDGSWFNNQFQSLVWDNPIRSTDFNNGLAPPSGPYDPSGYSNANGPVQGREALAPDNSMHVISAVGLYKLARRTTLNGTLQFTDQKQNAELIPFTINSVINSPQVLAAFPRLATLPRSTAEAEAQGVNALINLSSRPYRYMNVTVRYRYNKRDVQTPPFDATTYVAFDAAVEQNPEGFTPQFDNSRDIFDANVALTPAGWGTVRLGYGHEGVTREGRGFSDTGEHIFRASYDAFSNQYVTIRASFDYGHRRGEGFVAAASGDDEGTGGTQPTLRYYDEADRNRTRGTVLFTIMPADTVDLYVQFAGGKDEFLPDDSVPVSRAGELFGLHEQTNTSWNVGVNYHPTDVVQVGANYGRDGFGSFQVSRNASPPPDPTWTDPSRDWNLDNDDTINNFTLYLDLLRAVKNTDIRFGWDFSDSDNAFVHGGPRIASLTTAGQFIPLPNVQNTWNRVRADVQYFFSSKVGVGVGYYFEKLDITDFNTIDTNGPVGFSPATGDPRIDWLGELTLGYGNRPYSGSTTYLRLLYRF